MAVPKPAGVAEDDLLLVWLATNAGSGLSIVNVPAGWTQLVRVEDQDSGANETAELYWKIATATEVAASTFDFDFEFGPNNRQAAFGCTALRNVDTVTPFDTTTTTAAPSVSSSTPDPPSITTVTDGAWVLGFIAHEADDTYTPPTGYTLAWEDSSTGDTPSEHTSGAVAYKEVATAGAEDPGAFTGSTNDGWVAATVAVRPGAVAASSSGFAAWFGTLPYDIRSDERRRKLRLEGIPYGAS